MWNTAQNHNNRQHLFLNGKKKVQNDVYIKLSLCYKKDIYKYILYRHSVSLVKDCLLGRELAGWRQGREISLHLSSSVHFESMHMYYLLKINSFLGKR